MAETRTNRRLAAILAADVVGYSRLMGSDEGGTLAALKAHRATVFDPAVAANGGRIVKLIGDGTLVEFASVVDAVTCALAVQRAMAAQSTPGPPIRLRIGLNLGDVIIDGDDIYGDGVNVAARLEPLAEPGGICAASIVNESVGNRIDVRFIDGGEVTVKNIDRPIRVWKWHPGADAGPAAGTPPAVAEKAKPVLPSIAVLPFTNMSGDPEQDYFSDGITEDIITDLSNVGGLLVIARNSSFAYKGKSVDIRTVGRELGVKSVLEGSIRRAGSRVRITAQLIDAETGGHAWAQRYDRDLTDIFAVQDEVTRHIVEALRVKLTASEAARIADVPTSVLEAHDCFLRGREFVFAAAKTPELFAKAKALFERAIELDPGYGDAYAGLSWAHIFDFQNHWSGNPEGSLDRAREFADRAIEMDAKSPFAHHVRSIVAIWDKDLERTRTEADAALALNPNFALAHTALGIVHIYSGDPLAAIPYIERSLRLDPAYSQQYLHFLGSAYLVAGKYETASVVFKQRVLLVPETDLTRAFLASALGHLGEADEARRVWHELKAINPKYSFEEHVGRLPFRNQADVDGIRSGLAKAGLPD